MNHITAKGISMQSTLLATLAITLVVLNSYNSTPETLPTDIQITVEIKKYSVTLTPASIKANTIKFNIRNIDTIKHEFEIIKTNLTFDKLPIDVDQGKAKENELVKQIKNVLPNKVTTITANLE